MVVTVMGPFKAKYKVAQNDWMLSHPGKTITIHNVVELAGQAFENSFTIKNIVAGFKTTGIYPFNRNAFSDEDFDAANVTDRPIVEQTIEPVNTPVEPQPSTSSCSFTSPQPTTSLTEVSSSPSFPVEIVRPFPKAPARSEKPRGRKRGRSKILTETPEKEALEQQKIEKEKK